VKSKTYWFIFIGLMIFSYSCIHDQNKPSKSNTQIDEKQLQESVLKANRYLVRTENEDISQYIKRHQLQMTETGSGLRYQITKSTNDPLIRKGQVVRLKYITRFLTGDIVYQSKTDGEKIFQVGKGGVESGLEEAILLLRKGEEAKIIIPSHLAFGLLGDQNKIPPRTALVYEIEVVDVQ